MQKGQKGRIRGEADERQRFGQRITALRLRQRLTQKEVGQHLDVSTQTLMRWERGDSSPALFRIPMLANALGVPVDALFCDSELACLGTVLVGPETLKRIRKEGEPAIVEIAGVLASRLEGALRHARPLLDPPPGPAFARRRRRSRPVVTQEARLDEFRRLKKQQLDREKKARRVE